MKSDGQTFKEIRESRKIYQNEISKGEISRTTISKFENDKVTLSSTNFYFLLDSVDISLEEFNYIKNNYSYKNKERIILLFNQIFSNSEDTFIDELIVLCNKYLKENYSRSIQCILNILYALKSMNDSPNQLNCRSKIYIADVWNILSDVDSWTILDLKIINCCLHFFDPKTYIPISKQLIASLKKYKNFSNIILLETSIYLNLSILFLLENNKEYSKKYIEIALKKAYESKRIDYISIALIRYGIIFNNKDFINDGLRLIHIIGDSHLGDSHLEAAIKSEIENFNKNKDLTI